LAVMTEPNIIDILKTRSLFPHRDCHSQGFLVIFKTVAGNPGRPSWELNII